MTDNLQDYPIDYVTEDTPLPITPDRFKQLKEALRINKESKRKGSGKFYFKKDIIKEFKTTKMTLWRVEKSRTFNMYQKIWRKK